MQNDLNSYINEGINYFKKKDFYSSEKIFKKALKKFPNQQILHTYLLPCLIHQYKYEDALNYAKNFHKSGTMMEISSLYLGIIYFQTTQLETSLKYFDIALSLNSKNYEALVNKAAVLNKLDKNQEAKKLLDNAIIINPERSIAYRNYGAIYEDECDFHKAEHSYYKAIKKNPQDHQSIYDLSHIQLAQKKYAIGWKNYEHRWSKANIKLKFKYPQIPRLVKLEEIQGKRILIWSEQGMGDTIQFSRYVRHLIKLGAEIVFEVQEPLVEFLKDQFDCQVTNVASDLNFDFQSPLLSLPAIFRNEDNYFKFIGPYFFCSKNKYEFWREILNKNNNKLNLGVTISGNTKQINEDRRKISLKFFNKFFDKFNIFIIQKDISSEDKNIVNNNSNMFFLGDDPKWKNFTDTSAIIENMDYIVSIDTSIIHLAGSMNKPSLLLLSKPAEWRWGQDNKSTPNWYQSLNILRQKERRNWDSIQDDIDKILNNLTQNN